MHSHIGVAPTASEPVRTPNNPYGDERETQVAVSISGQGRPIVGPATPLTPAELASRTVSAGTLETIAGNFARDGYAIVPDVYTDHALLDRLQAKLDSDSAHQVAKLVYEDRRAGRSYDNRLLHIQQAPPRTGEWTYPEMVANPVVEQISAALLGGAAFIRYINGNTKLPEPRSETPKGVQNLHMDGAGWSVNSEAEALAHNIPWPHPPLKLFCHIAIDEMNPENGSTEIWAGTHMLIETAGKAINTEIIEARRASVPPCQVVIPKGAAFFVDLRMWHRGMPNYGELPRHMLGIGYCAERDPNGECSHLGMGKQRHVFSASARDAFNAFERCPLVDRNVDGEVDHWGNVLESRPAVGSGGERGLAGATDTGEGDGRELNENGPYAGHTTGARSRFDFWLPGDGAPEVDAAGDMPGWLQKVVAGQPLRG